MVSKIFVILAVFFFCNNQAFSNPVDWFAKTKVETGPGIDSMDVVTFDLENATVIGQVIEIPVYITTDDVINALDFSMWLNLENLQFDTVIDHTNLLQYVAHVNPNDHKLLFTSNSFSPYPTQPQIVVSIRFTVTTSFVTGADFDMFATYLNGDLCSHSFIGKGIAVSNKETVSAKFSIHPNPASNEIIVSSDEKATAELFDAMGHALFRNIPIERNITNIISVSTLPRGHYVIALHYGKDQTITKNIVLH
jgi:hypothetical protein